MIESIETPVGRIVFAVHGGALCALGFEEQWPSLLANLTRRLGALDRAPHRSPFGLALARYFEGDVGAIDAIPTDAFGTAFQRRVWDVLRTIPAGLTSTYSDVAARIDRPSASRAVGAANGRNPVSIVVPCHRVIAKGGTLCGYAGGEARKRWLLAHEARALA